MTTVPSGWVRGGGPAWSTHVSNVAGSVASRSLSVSEPWTGLARHSMLPTGMPCLTRSATQPTSVTAPSRRQSKAPLHNSPLLRSARANRPMPICRRLLAHSVRRLASRASCTAGSSRATSTPMIEMTTSNSTRVNAAQSCWRPRWGAVRARAHFLAIKRIKVISAFLRATRSGRRTGRIEDLPRTSGELCFVGVSIAGDCEEETIRPLRIAHGCVKIARLAGRQRQLVQAGQNLAGPKRARLRRSLFSRWADSLHERGPERFECIRREEHEAHHSKRLSIRQRPQEFGSGSCSRRRRQARHSLAHDFAVKAAHRTAGDGVAVAGAMGWQASHSKVNNLQSMTDTCAGCGSRWAGGRIPIGLRLWTKAGPARGFRAWQGDLECRTTVGNCGRQVRVQFRLRPSLLA